MCNQEQRNIALNHIESEILNLKEIYDTDGKDILQIVRHVEKTLFLLRQLSFIDHDEAYELSEQLGKAREEAALRGGHTN